MNALRLIAALGFVLGLGACGSMEPASRNSLVDISGLSVASKNTAQVVALAPQYDVAEIRISVPETLKVSEANLFYPVADIVWRGDPRGDRYTQVKAIFDESVAEGTQGMTTGPRVIVEVEVLRFHALTEKTRYTVGGTHSLKFNLTLLDAATGLAIEGPRRVVADIRASGGAKAIAEDQAGRTQRVVIVEHLAQVIRQELSARHLVTEPGAVLTSRLQSNLILSPIPVRD
ncbi:MAG: hypothetical protein Q8P60_01340 [Pseudorhodobacter sp.]|nr:hypothetical protein [Pseudorhodobacter sp.]